MTLPPREIKLAADTSYTISEDLADGKLAQKDRDLRLLLKPAASSPAAAEQPERGSITQVRNTLLTRDLAACRAKLLKAKLLKAELVHSNSRRVMETLSLPQLDSNKKRKVERKKAYAATGSGRSGHRHPSQKLEKVSVNLGRCFSSLFTR